MDTGTQRAMVKNSAAAFLKQQGEALASKVTLPFKVAPKRKGTGKENHPTKKVTG